MYTVRIFMKCTHVCAAKTTYQFFTKSKIGPDFPCSADEKAEPRPDMNIKVTAFTESKKFYYTTLLPNCYPIKLQHICYKHITEPWYEISNNVVFATGKASDQPSHTHSLISSLVRAFASRLNVL